MNDEVYIIIYWDGNWYVLQCSQMQLRLKRKKRLKVGTTGGAPYQPYAFLCDSLSIPFPSLILRWQIVAVFSVVSL